MEPWRTGITTSDEKSIFIRGYDVTSLMQQATFTETIFLLHQGRLPTKEERALFDAILIGVSDHGPAAPSAAAARIVASGNRRSLEAAVAAGVLAMGDAHGGAAYDCMQMICDGVAVARREGLSLQDAARRAVADAKSGKRRLPGIGHRVHTEDPRTRVLFEMAPLPRRGAGRCCIHAGASKRPRAIRSARCLSTSTAHCRLYCTTWDSFRRWVNLYLSSGAWPA